MLQKLPVHDFGSRKNRFTFDEEFIQDYDKNCDEEYIPEVDVKYPKKLHELHGNLPFLLERININLCVICMTRKTM